MGLDQAIEGIALHPLRFQQFDRHTFQQPAVVREKLSHAAGPFGDEFFDLVVEPGGGR